VKFLIPNPDTLRISECGMYLIEKIPDLRNPGSQLYVVYEFKRVLGGCKSAADAVAAVITREADFQDRERQFFAEAPNSASLHHRSVLKPRATPDASAQTQCAPAPAPSSASDPQ
jgi:hypothetical protein